MNIDTQFPQPLAPALSQRPLDKPVEQTTTRPVENPRPSDGITDKPQREAAKSRNEDPKTSANDNSRAPRNDAELNQDEKAEVEKLRARDREVRAHEAAHKTAAGSYARGSAQFSFESGPDGRRYAVGGEVSIDTSKTSGDPEATIRKAQTIRRAANAPAQPSGQDRSVAAQATQMETEARRELLETKNSSPEGGPAESASEAGHSTPTSPENRIQNAGTEPAPVGDLLDVIV
ncbi:SprA family protein [Thiogranum longum]|uniref:SprA family protein n=1 Tax=Thiogranum longum TaxID=1537524 RepID=A0A4R1H5G5_9GAMM|nr:putative metalloprotease CJM1_0395 family protein [Thiogranum longum]TCK16964.1 SprA family protein [Thiogranum longum]